MNASGRGATYGKSETPILGNRDGSKRRPLAVINRARVPMAFMISPAMSTDGWRIGTKKITIKKAPFEIRKARSQVKIASCEAAPGQNWQ